MNKKKIDEIQAYRKPNLYIFIVKNKNKKYFKRENCNKRPALLENTPIIVL